MNIPDPVADQDEIYKSNMSKIGSGIENIKIYNNVLSFESIKTLQDYVKSTEFTTSIPTGYGVMENKLIIHEDMPKNIFNILQKVFDVAKLRAETDYQVKLDDYDTTGLLLTKWKPGDFMDEHVDTWFVHHTHIAALFYINDDYEGGEINFPKYKLSIRPRSNSLIIFPGSETYIHSVNKVVSSNRYTSNIWYKFKGSTYEGFVY